MNVKDMSLIEFICVRDVRNGETMNVSPGKDEQIFTLEQVYINPRYIVSMENTELYEDYLNNGNFPKELNKKTEIARLLVNEGGYSSSEYFVISTLKDIKIPRQTPRRVRKKKEVIHG